VIPVPVDQIVFKELQIVGSIGMQATRYPAMLRMVESGTIQPGKLVRETIPVEEAGAVLAGMGEFDTVGTYVIDEW
jgi:D-arabinose 1-dehydrogenase-like Zn-dependent alcohol dehydrogenase